MICKDEAIVLRSYDFRETSKIAIFYTKNFGKMSGLLKGIRKDPKKFASNLDFLSINEIVFYKKIHSELHLVSQCDLRRGFSGIRGEVAKFGLASFCAELINAVSAVEDKNAEIYSLLVAFLDTLDKQEFSGQLIYNFILRVLNLSGFQPHLENCIICKSVIKDKAFFSHRFGGLLCSACAGRDGDRDDINQGTISSLLYFQNTSWPQSLRLGILPKVKTQLHDIIFSFLHFHLEKRFRSLSVLNELLDQ